MGVLGIASSTLFNYLTTQTSNLQSNQHQFQQEFSQLGQDLQTGNLSAAQSDFATLQQEMPQSSSTSGTSSSTSSQSPIAQAFSQLAQDLKSGNLSGAQQDYSTIQQDFQSQSAARQLAHGHHHPHGGSSNSDSSTINVSALPDARFGEAVAAGGLFCAHSVKPFGRGRPWLRWTRALCKFN
jgi:outer membrane protein assembly factor BamD (BamD/ComL family)